MLAKVELNMYRLVQNKRISRLSAVILMLTVVGIAVAAEPKNPFHQYCSRLATHQLTIGTFNTLVSLVMENDSVGMLSDDVRRYRALENTPIHHYIISIQRRSMSAARSSCRCSRCCRPLNFTFIRTLALIYVNLRIL